MKLSDFFQLVILFVLIILNLFWTFLLVMMGVEKIVRKKAFQVNSEY